MIEHDENQMRVCTRCRKSHPSTQFFSFKDGSKDWQCKACRSEIDLNNEEEVRIFCKDFDIPYIKEEWQKRYEREKEKYNGLIKKQTICGKYLATMKLKVYKDFTYEDSDELNEERRIKMSQEYDVVNKPKHYNREGGFESIEEMEMVFGTEAVMHFCLCNVWKYRYRAADKNGEEDLRKSDWYMKKYCELKNKDKNTMTITDSGIKIAPWIPATSTTPAITYLNDNKDNI